ncbi:MAG: HlyD family secretion protein [Betaproteobacteria bacterium]|nr:HlyD family secretion protein [Betaproteobacteria bacterium]MDE2622201.1 HlyD family secretion protein [Betaproteobacteria bacterium]
MSELPPNTENTTAPPAPARPWIRKAAMAGAALVVLGFFMLWLLTRNQETTDDAFIEANIVQISPHVAGYVLHVQVNDNQVVKAGDVLAEIDPRDYQLRVQQAEAALAGALARHGAASQDVSVVTTTSQALINQAQSALESSRALRAQADAQVAAAEAQAQLAHSDLARYQALFSKDEISRQRLDQAVTADRAAAAQLDAARRGAGSAAAQVSQAQAKLAEARSGPRQVALKEAQEQGGKASVAEAQAALDQARLDLSYTRLVAPVDGRVARRTLYQGQLVQPGTSVMAIVYGNPWVVANFKETQLRRMHIGQPVEVTVDAFPGKTFKAHVDSFQPGTGARFSLLPPENASGNYVKVVQRLPVKIVFDEKPDTLVRLAPGMSVEPKVLLTEASR